jgi:hypothetical protein
MMLLLVVLAALAVDWTTPSTIPATALRAVPLGSQVFAFVGHNCPAGYERLIPLPVKAAAPPSPGGLQLPYPSIEPPEWQDISISRTDGLRIEMVWCTKVGKK